MRQSSVLWLSVTMLLATIALAEGQKAKTVPRIGYLSQASRSVSDDAFLQGLRELGYIEGQNIALDYRFAEGKHERLPELAAELVRLHVDVIVADGLAAQAAKHTTQTIPIVFTTGGDPVVGGLVASLARPGGNITGLSTQSLDLSGKWLELLKETVPKIARVAVFWVASPLTEHQLQELERAAQELGIRLQSLEIRGPADFDHAFAAMQSAHAEALVLLPSRMFTNNRTQLVALASKGRLPMMSQSSQMTEAGGLMSYGTHVPDLFRRAATYVDKILKGANPAELPVERPLKFELVINLKTAQELGLTIPPHMLVRADKVIR